MTLRPLVCALLAAASAAGAAPRVKLEQFGMVQCPMTSTWLNHFHSTCLVYGQGIDKIVDFTEQFVGGTHGGPVVSIVQVCACVVTYWSL